MGNKKIKHLKTVTAGKVSQEKIPLDFELTEDPVHLYMAWDPKFDKDQMYKIRHVLQSQGRAWIAKISVTKNKKPIEDAILQSINSQVTTGKETRLYMTNFKSVHVYNIVSVQKNKPDAGHDKIIDTYRKKELDYELWIEVDDVYILSVDDQDNIRNEVNETLNELEVVGFCSGKTIKTDIKITPYISSLRYPVPVISKNNESYFRIISGLKYREKFGEKWYNTHRCVTKEYKVCSYHLQKNCFPGIWDKLSKPTQHFLIECEMKRIESCYYNSKQSFIILRQAWECYILAVISELYKMFFEEVSDDFKVKASKVMNNYNADLDLGQFFTLISEMKKVMGNTLGFHEKDRHLRNFVKDIYNDSGNLYQTLFALKELRNRLQHKLHPAMPVEDVPEVEFEKLMSLLRTNLMNTMLPIPANNLMYLLVSSREGINFENSHQLRSGTSLKSFITNLDQIVFELNKMKKVS